jgi:hypothetical protein
MNLGFSKIYFEANKRRRLDSRPSLVVVDSQPPIVSHVWELSHGLFGEFSGVLDVFKSFVLYASFVDCVSL